jgi:D-xylulose reductase
LYRYAFEDSLVALADTKAGKSKDGKGLIKAIISGPGVRTDEK